MSGNLKHKTAFLVAAFEFYFIIFTIRIIRSNSPVPAAISETLVAVFSAAHLHFSFTSKVLPVA